MKVTKLMQKEMAEWVKATDSITAPYFLNELKADSSLPTLDELVELGVFEVGKKHQAADTKNSNSESKNRVAIAREKMSEFFPDRFAITANPTEQLAVLQNIAKSCLSVDLGRIYYPDTTAHMTDIFIKQLTSATNLKEFATRVFAIDAIAISTGCCKQLLGCIRPMTLYLKGKYSASELAAIIRPCITAKHHPEFFKPDLAQLQALLNSKRFLANNEMDEIKLEDTRANQFLNMDLNELTALTRQLQGQYQTQYAVEERENNAMFVPDF